MKKNIIIAAIAAASALLLSVSCQKESLPELQNGINGGANTFTATIEQSLTKTTLTDGVKVNWTSADKISINGKTYTATPKDDATKASFTAEDGEATAVGGKFKAIYPSTLYVTGHFELPGTQTYSAGGFNAPMYAESTTQVLTFKNICAVLAIKVTKEDIATLKSIKVKSDKKLNGTISVYSTSYGYYATISTGGTEEVVLSLSDAISLTSDGTTFYIAIPAEQKYSYLKIYLSEDGTLYKRAMITKKAAGLGTIKCNKIYNIDYQTNAVQLYANGPYWSTMNIGATTPTDYGWYFSWGNTTGYLGTDGSYSFTPGNYKDTNGYKLKNNIPVNAEYDAAYANWGAAWKMPTGGEFGQFTALKDNTTNAYSTGVKGKTFTGKNSYSDITLFFPAAGYRTATNLMVAGSDGYYWSSSLRKYPGAYADKAFHLYFIPGGNVVFTGNDYWTDCYYGYSVRPVSD